MTGTIDWNVRAEALKGELASVENAAAAGQVAAEAMSELKRAVDHCRTALWAATITSSDAQHASDAALLAARFVRVQEMCERIVEAVAAGRIWTGTPGLGRFLASLEATERTVRPLLDESVPTAPE